MGKVLPFSFFWVSLLALAACSNGKSPAKQAYESKTLNGLYQFLRESLPNGDGTFYDKPSSTKIVDYIQTPDFWNKSDINLAYFMQESQRLNQDPDLLLPYCQSNADCISDNNSKVLGQCVYFDAANRNLCVGHSDLMLNKWYQQMSQAKASIDIVSYDGNGWVNPDQRFIGLLRKIIENLANSNKVVIIRLMFGVPQIGFSPATPTLDPTNFIKQLTQGITINKLKVYVGTIQTCNLGDNCTGPYGILNKISYNHSKIIIVDKQTIITGGHNMIAADYMTYNPIYDISYIVSGLQLGDDATNFVNVLWDFTIKNLNSPAFTSNANSCASYINGNYGMECPAALSSQINPASNTNTNAISMMITNGGVGLTANNEFHNLSDKARDYILMQAQNNINIFQQDIALHMPPYVNTPLYSLATLPNGLNLIDILAFKAINNVNINMVLTNYGATGASGGKYSSHVHTEDVALQIYNSAIKQFTGQLSTTQIKLLLCNNVYISTIHYSDRYATWSDGSPIGLHVKMYSIDNHVFYIGSKNFYPFDMQEFGILNDSAQQYNILYSQYLSNLLNNSRPYAISGSMLGKCIFNDF